MNDFICGYADVHCMCGCVCLFVCLWLNVVRTISDVQFSRRLQTLCVLGLIDRFISTRQYAKFWLLIASYHITLDLCECARVNWEQKKIGPYFRFISDGKHKHFIGRVISTVAVSQLPSIVFSRIPLARHYIGLYHLIHTANINVPFYVHKNSTHVRQKRRSDRPTYYTLLIWACVAFVSVWSDCNDSRAQMNLA